ncbi:MAG: dTMP kinase [Pseudonocardiaceae bacterium]
MPCRRGLLVSVEGITGVGKTYLTTLLHTRGTNDGEPVILDEFSQRAKSDHSDLGRGLLRALIDAAAGDRFLRGGFPGAETLLLLAIKMHDYESCLPALRHGYLVVEGRSLHTVAVYQSLIMHPDDDPQALAEARALLHLAQQWRPLPDLTILITDDVPTALYRAQERDDQHYPPEHWRLHHRAAALFTRLAADDPARIHVLDRRTLDTREVVRRMETWIGKHQASLPCLMQPWQAVDCQWHCRLGEPMSPG